MECSSRAVRPHFAAEAAPAIAHCEAQPSGELKRPAGPQKGLSAIAPGGNGTSQGAASRVVHTAVHSSTSILQSSYIRRPGFLITGELSVHFAVRPDSGRFGGARATTHEHDTFSLRFSFLVRALDPLARRARGGAARNSQGAACRGPRLSHRTQVKTSTRYELKC